MAPHLFRFQMLPHKTEMSKAEINMLIIFPCSSIMCTSVWRDRKLLRVGKSGLVNWLATPRIRTLNWPFPVWSARVCWASGSTRLLRNHWGSKTRENFFYLIILITFYNCFKNWCTQILSSQKTIDVQVNIIYILSVDNFFNKIWGAVCLFLSVDRLHKL